MGLHFGDCNASALFFMGITQTIGNMKKRKYIVDNVFSKHMKGVDNKEGWEKVKKVIGTHGMRKIMPSGSCSSKPDTQGDGVMSPFTISKTNFDYYTMYSVAVSEDILINSSDFEIFIDPTKDLEKQITSGLKWDALCQAYDVIENVEFETADMFEAIKPLYESDEEFKKSPAQLYFYGGDNVNGWFFEGRNKLATITWDMLDLFKSNGGDPKIINIMFEYPINDLWYIDIPEMKFESSNETKTIYNPDPSRQSPSKHKVYLTPNGNIKIFGLELKLTEQYKNSPDMAFSFKLDYEDANIIEVTTNFSLGTLPQIDFTIDYKGIKV